MTHLKVITGDLILKQQTVLTDISALRSEEEGACTLHLLVLGVCFSILFVFTCAWNKACHFAFAV